MAMRAYDAECRAFVLGASGQLPHDDVDWAMHLIDVGEAPEGIALIARSIERIRGSIEVELGRIILRLVDGLVPRDALPETLPLGHDAPES